LDLQALQMPEINEGNYNDILPIVVANIWSIYLNKVIIQINKEKDLEIENLKLKNEIQNSKTNIMQSLEDEFNLFLDEYNNNIIISCVYKNKQDRNNSMKRTFQMNMIYAINIIYFHLQGEITEYGIKEIIIEYIEHKISPLTPLESFYYEADFSTTIMDKLTIFGFINRNFNPKNTSNNNSIISAEKFLRHNYEIFLKSEKFDKFILWLKLKKVIFDINVIEIQEK